MTDDELETMYNIKNKKNVKILRPDKWSGLVIVSVSEYNNKMINTIIKSNFKQIQNYNFKQQQLEINTFIDY